MIANVSLAALPKSAASFEEGEAHAAQASATETAAKRHHITRPTN
jgi:hypothetical protein